MKGRFHRRFLFGAMVAVLAVPILARPPYAHEYLVKIGDLAPDFTIRQADGKTYQLSDLRGSVVMLQFTASWCSVCRGEMPFIEKEIWQAWRDKGLHVIGIDRDEPIETVNSFAKQVGISYPLALDPGADIFARYAQKDSGVTRNVIIDRNGRIIFLTRLFDRAEFNKMKARIEEELGKEE
ncbi:MAG: TlpA disulfide reductase family protein [Acidobacteriota bacterium]